MPFIAHEDDPWYPYGYRTKERYVRKEYKTFPDGNGGWTEWIDYSRPRLPPNYFTKGYKFYSKEMNRWMKQLERDRNDYYDRWSKQAGRTIYPKSLENYYGIDMVPVYYSYTDFLKKSAKYAKRRRAKLLAEIAKKRQDAIVRRRIYLNKQAAIAKRKLIVARGLNKY